MLHRQKILESLLELSGGSTPRSRPELLAVLMRNALLLAAGDGVTGLIANGRRFERWVLHAAGASPESLGTPRAGSEFARLLLQRHQPLATADLGEDRRIGLEDACPGVESGPALFVPLRVREHSTGYLAVYRRRGAARFTAQEARLIALLSAWAAMALENLRLSENLEKLAVTDDLTQVYNYRYLKTALRREIKRAMRFRQQLSLIMVDVDDLKAYNDRHGHLRGSFVLKEIAGLLASQVRSWDVVAKYGGDEFTVILPQTDRDGALAAAERLRAAVELHAFPLAERGEITVSLGVASLPADAETPSGLIEAADRALYAAKQHGRNRVETMIREVA